MSARRTPLWGYLTAQAVSITGTRLSMIAIPWFVLTTTGSATRTGLVAFAEMAPLVLLQFLSGPLIDRLGARRVAVTCDWGSALVVGTVPLLHQLDLLTFPALLALVAVAGALRGPGDAARHAMLPLLVEQSHLPTERVTGLDGTVERTASLAGAAIAGGVVAAVGGADALVVDAASFLVSAVVLVATTRGLATATPAAEARSPSGVRGYLRELREGWTFTRRDPVLMGIAVMVAVTNLLDQAWSVVLVPVWAHDSGNGVAAVGVLAATFGGAAVLGSLVATAYAERLPRHLTYLVCFFLGGVPRFVALALDAPLWAILLVAVVGGCAAGFINPVLGAVLFERTPAHLMGRVSAMNIAMSWSLIPLGGVLGGVAVGAFGLAPALLLVGGAYLVTTLAPAAQPRWREMDSRSGSTQADPAGSRVSAGTSPPA